MPETEDELVIKQQREQTAFSGTKTNVSVVSGALQLTNPVNNLTGTYDFANILDLVAAYQNLRLKRHIKSEGFNISDSFGSLLIFGSFITSPKSPLGSAENFILRFSFPEIALVVSDIDFLISSVSSFFFSLFILFGGSFHKNAFW